MRKLFGGVVAGVLLVGCGGSSGHGGGGSGPVGAYGGSFGGEYLDEQGNPEPVSLTITGSNGSIQGQYGPANSQTSFSGQINSSGMGLISYGGFSYPVAFSSAGGATLSAILDGPASAPDGAFLALISNPNDTFGGANPFTGDYAGTTHNTTLNESGVAAWTVSSTGAISGTSLIEVDGTPEFTQITGTLASSGPTEYKHNALKLLEQVRVSGETVQITKRGRPIAQLVRVDEAAPQRAFGQFRGDVTIVGDIVGPIIDAQDWGELT